MSLRVASQHLLLAQPSSRTAVGRTSPRMTMMIRKHNIRRHATKNHRPHSTTSTVLEQHADVVQRPCPKQLHNLFIASSIPMMGFGFMDNLVLLLAGSYIDATVGATLGLATLTAAAAGQVVSDVSGVLSGGTLERVLGRWIPTVKLTIAERRLPIARNMALAGAVCGVVIGCLAGAVVGLMCIGVYEEPDTEALEKASEIVQEVLQEHSGVFYAAPGVLENMPVASRFQTIQSVPDHDNMIQACYEQRHTQKDGDGLYVPVVGKGGACWGVISIDPDRADDGTLPEVLSKTVSVVLDKLVS